MVVMHNDEPRLILRCLSSAKLLQKTSKKFKRSLHCHSMTPGSISGTCFRWVEI